MSVASESHQIVRKIIRINSGLEGQSKRMPTEIFKKITNQNFFHLPSISTDQQTIRTFKALFFFTKMN